jgi:hypothetical protein
LAVLSLDAGQESAEKFRRLVGIPKVKKEN